MNKLPKSGQARAKQMIHNIYLSASKKEAESAWKKFISSYEAKYPKAVQCLTKDKEELLAFYNFPGEHWIHLRTTNPIESTFATVKHRTRKSRNCFSRNTIIAATFKLLMEAETRWRPLRGKNRIAQVINMEKFIDGIHHNDFTNNNLKHQIYAA